MTKYFQCYEPVLVAISPSPQDFSSKPGRGSGGRGGILHRYIQNKPYPNICDNIATKEETPICHKTNKCLKR